MSFKYCLSVLPEHVLALQNGEKILVTCSLRVEAVAVSPLMDEGEQGMVAGPEAEEHCLAHVPVG